MYKLFLGFLAVLSFFVLMACEKGDDDSIARAQQCLDGADNTNVAVCEAMVTGITGQRAAVIRCSANFISQGFNANRFANAFVQLKQQSAGQNATLGMMAYLVFNANSTNAARLVAVNTAVANCNETGLAGMKMFANFAKASTVVACGIPGLTLDPANPPTPAELQAGLSTFSGSDADLGAAVTGVSEAYCGTTSSTSNAAFCTQVNDAASQGGAAAVGARIRALLAVVP